MRLSPENEFLIRTLRSYLGRHESRLEKDPGWDRLDWNKVISVARAHDLFPLFYYVLSRQDLLGNIPRFGRQAIEEGFLANTASTLLCDNLFDQVMVSFHQANIPFIVLKGPSIALEFYHPREVRPYRDLDLLIRGEDFERVKEVLSKVGLSVTGPEREMARRRYFNSVGFLRPGDSEAHLDLHWETLMVSWNPRPFLSNKKVWEEIRWLECPGMELSVLQPQVLIQYLCIHLAFHHQFGRLLTLCDLDLVIQKFGGKVDWDEIVRESRALMIRKPVYYSLLLAVMLLRTEVPESVLIDLGKQKAGRLFPVGYLVFREKPLPTNVERVTKFVLIDGLRGKFNSLVTFCRQR